jgi:hypothetical protein
MTWCQGDPFLQASKKPGQVLKDQEAQDAFEDLKKYLTTPPTLVAPVPQETLQPYISSISNVVSMVIIVERGESSTNRKIQYLVYYICKVPSDSKPRYFHIMKLAYALQITSRKISHYFLSRNVPRVHDQDDSVGPCGGRHRPILQNSYI